jgi:RHS repeat-associated protein
MTYSADGLLSTFENARGLTSTMSYDDLGRLELDEDPAGGSHSLVRTEDADSTEWTVTRRTALGRTTTYTTLKPPTGDEVKTVVDPSGLESTLQSGPDRVKVAIAPDGTTFTVAERADARFGLNPPLTSQTVETPAGLVSTESTSRSYSGLNPSNLLDFFDRTDVTTRNGRNWSTRFELPTSTFTTTSPQGRQTYRIIDPRGRTTRTQVASLLPVDFFYDSSGRLDRVTQGIRTTQSAYFPTGAAAGYLQGITDATGIPTTFTRDALGRTLTETRSAATTSFNWDPLSNLTSVTPPGKPVHEMSYTPVNLLETYEPPAAGLPVSATSYTYDLDRILRTETRPGGVSIVSTPDSAGRLDTIAIPGGVIDYDYVPSDSPSGAGKVSDIRGPYGVDLAFTYDGSLTTSMSWSGDVTGSVTWQYNNDFLKILETVSGATGTGQTAFGYDNDLLLTCASPTTCSPPSADALTLTRHSQHGMVTGISLGQTSETWIYNAYGELARQTTTFDGAPLVDLIYDEAGFERDALGRIVRKTETILGVTKVHEYRYDTLQRLDQVKVDGVVDEEFTYDANGNRLTYFKQGVGTVSATYDDQDRLLTYGTWTFTYAANGEMETKSNTATNETWLFQYDALGNLVSVGLPNGDLVEYLVDGIGRRAGKKVNGVLVKRWVYRDLLKPVAELDAAGSLVGLFAYGSNPTVPDYVVRGGATYRVFSDHLGSPRYAVNVANAGDVPFTASYTSFGEVTGTGLDWMPFGFAGGIGDVDTKLVRFGARDYDAIVGRWTSKDPILHTGGNNLYAYAMNNPVTFRDQWGLNPNACMISPVACEGPVTKGMRAAMESIIDWFTSATISMCGESEREKNCEALYENDLDSCRAIGKRNKSRAARCYAAAMERKNACKQGKPLPPLHGWN